MATLAWQRYGKSRVRLVKIRRPAHEAPGGRVPHEIVDLTVDVHLEGAFDAVYTDGDNGSCLATDTMKNTIYALARHDDIVHVESFGLRLAEHFINKPAVTRVRVTTTEQQWQRLTANGAPHPHAFVQPGGEQWTAVVTRDRAAIEIVSGLANLVVLKTTDSAFAGFPRDEFTTLPETGDRILATSVSATWRYADTSVDFAVRERIRAAMLETFAAHESRSVQHTLFAMAEAALDACSAVADVTLTMPNRHHLLVDLAPFGLDNPNVVFVATDQPYGLIEARVTRSGGGNGFPTRVS